MHCQQSDRSISNLIEHEEIHPINENSRSELIHTIKTIDDWMELYLKENSYDSNLLHFYLFPVGSITYHKSYPDSSKDFLICFPSIITLDKIQDCLLPYLKRIGKFQMIINVHWRLVPVLQLVRQNCIFELLICFLPSPYCVTKKPQFNLRNPPHVMLKQMDLNSILALNSLRNCLLIRDYLGDSFPLYQETLFQLKKWSIFKLIYHKSTSYYLNGTALAIMLACVFRRTGTTPTSVGGTLFVFFRHFLELNFSKRSISLNLMDFRDNMRQIVMENPDFMIPQNGAILTVLTPAMPHQNCTRRINRFVLERIIGQFKNAFTILQSAASKLVLPSALMQPLTLVDFLREAKSIEGVTLQLVLLSTFEEESLVDHSAFVEFTETMVAQLRRSMSSAAVIHYPLPIRNVCVGSSAVRVRRFVVCDYSGEAQRSAALIMADSELPNGMNFTIEEINHDDCRLASMNFDNVEKIVRLIYTDI